MFRFILATIAAFTLTGALITTASAEDEARVRVVHASPDAPAVDIYANGSKVLSDVPFGAASGYPSVPAGSYEFEVFVAGSTNDPVLSISADLAAGSDYSVIALDRVANLDSRSFVDDNSSPAEGMAHISVIHASPDAPAVDIAVKDGPVLVSDLAFGEQAGPLPVDAATYDLEIRAASTDTVALPLNGVTLEAGNVYTVVAIGLLEGDPELSVLTLVTTPEAVVMAPPSAGDAGLAAATESNRGLDWAFLAGGAIAFVLAGLAARRLAPGLR